MKLKQIAPKYRWRFRKAWENRAMQLCLFSWLVVTGDKLVSAEWQPFGFSVLVLVAVVFGLPLLGPGLWREELKRRGVVLASGAMCALLIVGFGLSSWQAGALALALFLLAFFGGTASGQRQHRDAQESQERKNIRKSSLS